MADSTQSNPAAPQTPAQVKRANAAQDKEMAAAITAGGVFIKAVLGDPPDPSSEVATLMAARSYDAAKLNAGLQLQGTAQTKFNERQTAMSAADTAQLKLTASRKDAINRFAAYRRDGRSGIRKATERQFLGLSGVVPKDTEQFVTIARAAYGAAADAQYAGTLSTFGYPAARRTQDLAALDTLEADERARNRTAGIAERATDSRDTAFKAFDEWQN